MDKLMPLEAWEDVLNRSQNLRDISTVGISAVRLCSVLARRTKTFASMENAEIILPRLQTLKLRFLDEGTSSWTEDDVRDDRSSLPNCSHDLLKFVDVRAKAQLPLVELHLKGSLVSKDFKAQLWEDSPKTKLILSA
ncbi:hypothetical protein FA95DRAFT_1614029 [Auriscalpium vulgare]|uniref:Uncharacterized protein n=1 Tax=Auriscalpium vulgare TaxID=40419 RepID=A0ACB8R0Q4_9AGAM|nr:hypothetical protein FA95DRAFT_1614029 [Auriscalpium vulgare]